MISETWSEVESEFKSVLVLHFNSESEWNDFKVKNETENSE